MVTFKNYSQCKITEDGQYLIPDNVFVTALKESKASLHSELIDHWSNYSSMTSTTVNVEAHESFFGSVSGSFSYENQDIKKRQVINFDSLSTRVEKQNQKCGTGQKTKEKIARCNIGHNRVINEG